MEYGFDFISWPENLCTIWKGTVGAEEESEERNRIKRDSEAGVIQNDIQGHSHSTWLDMNWLKNKFITP